MAAKVIAPNRIKEFRLAAGMPLENLWLGAGIGPDRLYKLEAGRAFPTTPELEGILKALGGLAVEQVYVDNWRQALGLEPRPADTGNDATEWFEVTSRVAERLFVSPDEMTWLEKRPRPEDVGEVDVYLSLSCSVRKSPHLLLDTIAVCEALGVRLAAGAGIGGCCGSPFIRSGQPAKGARWMKAKEKNLNEIGAKVNVNWCTNCQVKLGGPDRLSGDGDVAPVSQVHILTFLNDRVRELGDAVPWKNEVNRRVVSEGHWAWTDVHRTAQVAQAHLLGQIPGVQVMGLYDGHSVEAPCGGRTGRPAFQPPWRADVTPADVRERRRRIEERMAGFGADTVACQHQDCHTMWAPYATDKVAVVHAVSILAEALGCAHPDRHQAASLLGDPAAVVEQTRPIWSAWNIPDTEAYQLAAEVTHSRYAQGVSSCGCGGEGGGCQEKLISVDVLSGAVT